MTDLKPKAAESPDYMKDKGLLLPSRGFYHSLCRPVLSVVIQLLVDESLSGRTNLLEQMVIEN